MGMVGQWLALLPCITGVLGLNLSKGIYVSSLHVYVDFLQHSKNILIWNLDCELQWGQGPM